LEFYICNGVLNVNEKVMKALLKKGKMNKHDGRRGKEF
jgi:polyhydroxyalkanoate synthesis regulator phasin